MAIIKEDYCSQEVYRLLREKEFESEIHTTFDKEGYTQASITLQVAMKWLREVHKLYINIWADPKDVESNDFDIIFRAQVYNGTSNYGTYEFSTYEEACEEAIKYCLENLI